MSLKKAPFDVIFISYDEPNAEENFQRLRKFVPNAKRVHGVKGIANAWVTAGNLAETSHFFTVDGDIYIKDSFAWEIQDFEGPNDQRVHVYRSENAVNGLVYGYGSVHLFPTSLVREFKNFDVLDFTLSVATKGFKIQPEVASITRFNTSSYASWKSGFREAAKLASGNNAYAGTAPDERSLKRLTVWCSVGADAEFGKECILGARMGALYGFTHENIDCIGDYTWFQKEFVKLDLSRIDEYLAEFGAELRAKFGIECADLDATASRAVKRMLPQYGL